MARRRPPGARRRGPSVVALPGSPAAAAFARLRQSEPLVFFRLAHESEVMAEAQAFWNRPEWEGRTPPEASMIITGWKDDTDFCILVGYRLGAELVRALVSYLENHPRATARDGWDLWDAADGPGGLNGPWRASA